jgi:hypothetical protein
MCALLEVESNTVEAERTLTTTTDSTFFLDVVSEKLPKV